MTEPAATLAPTPTTPAPAAAPAAAAPAAPAAPPAAATVTAPTAEQFSALQAQAAQAQTAVAALEQWKGGVLRALGGDGGESAPDPAAVLRQAEVALQRAHVASLASEFNVRRPMDLAKVLDGPDFAVDIKTAALRNPAGARVAVQTYLAANTFWQHPTPAAPSPAAAVVPAVVPTVPAPGAVSPAGDAARPAGGAVLNGRPGARLFSDFASVMPTQRTS